MARKRSLLLAVFAVLLAACIAPHRGADASGEPAILTQADVIGAWQADDESTLIFSADGSFEASNLPYQLYMGFSIDHLPAEFDPETDQLHGSGWWELGSSPLLESDAPKHMVDLHVRELFGHPDATGLRLRAVQADGVIYLVFYIGDPDLGNVIRYKKCPDLCPSASPPLTLQPD